MKWENDGWYWLYDTECLAYLVEYLDKDSPVLSDNSYEIVAFLGKDFNNFLEIYGKARE